MDYLGLTQTLTFLQNWFRVCTESVRSLLGHVGECKLLLDPDLYLLRSQLAVRVADTQHVLPSPVFPSLLGYDWTLGLGLISEIGAYLGMTAFAVPEVCIIGSLSSNFSPSNYLLYYYLRSTALSIPVNCILVHHTTAGTTLTLMAKPLWGLSHLHNMAVQQALTHLPWRLITLRGWMRTIRRMMPVKIVTITIVLRSSAIGLMMVYQEVKGEVMVVLAEEIMATAEMGKEEDEVPAVEVVVVCVRATADDLVEI